MNTEQMKMDVAYARAYSAVVAEFGTQTKAKMYEFIDANGIIIKDRKNKTKEDIYKAIAGFKVQRVKAVAPIAEDSEEESEGGECCENCHIKTNREVWTDYLGTEILYCDECYDRHKVRIDNKCKKCKYRQSCPLKSLCKICFDIENQIDDDSDSEEEVMRRPKEEDSDSDMDSDYADCTECDDPNCCGECQMETEGHWFSDNCTVAFLERQIAFHKETVRLMEERIVVLKAEKKRKARAKKNQVPLRPTYNLKGTNGFGETYTLFRHYRPKVGFCKYAVYNDTTNHFVECEFNGKTISGFGEGTIHKTLNAWTTSNWREQRAKDNEPKKTVKNNAYKETDFMPIVIIDDEELIYGVGGGGCMEIVYAHNR